MKFAFEIFWMRDGSLESLFKPAPVDLRSIETARRVAEQLAAYVPVHSITIEAEDGSIFERWCRSSREWRRQHDLLRTAHDGAGGSCTAAAVPAIRRGYA